MITDMDTWTNIRRDVLAGGMSRRAACKKYNLNFRTIQKILSQADPPGYQQQASRNKPMIGPFLPIIHEILEADKKVHKKQRHTGKRIFDRLCSEHGYTGGITVVRDAIRRQQRSTAEVFMPLSHPPGAAQFDFGEAKAVYRGREIKVMFCVMSLPYSDAFFCQAFPRECTETFQEGHVRAFDFFGGSHTHSLKTNLPLLNMFKYARSDDHVVLRATKIRLLQVAQLDIRFQPEPVPTSRIRVSVSIVL